MLYDEEESENGDNKTSAAFSSDNENNVGYKDVYDVVTSSADEAVSDARGTKYVDTRLLEKIQAFEPVLEDAKEKIRMLETSLKETKLVLQGLAQHIEELKR
ncbi:PREDICTED: uncharacterized protein LOC105963382 [Erythranthe guttata]|uniref:uncharacterized protein LOC105963382 n=1 Tax=Erythranthe guttata TaxID=4155 RepID=UPI00064DAF14|nr:PREDICTED: uncharacterized protein LOC105963382 [Erythranthe guttata]|eukprot:XP_012843231.1 PREDICTED: uncharacterized protein LOC105963382 [Erythranthe guttata]